MPGAVDSHCDPRFEPLRDAFRLNFAERGELGAAVCVMVDNDVVADLYGGWADQEQGRLWQQHTLVNMFSVGKGLVAACAARLAGQDKLDLDATVAAYWPEFAAAGKDAITVRQLLSHQAGLPSVRRRLPPDSMLDWPAMTAALAGQEPWWEPGTGRPASASASSSPSPNGPSAPARRRSATSARAVRSASPTPGTRSPSAT
jgi:CubicO group peptidase (beta-lactamase class C family)